MKELDIFSRFKVVVRDKNGKVQKIHETTGSRMTLERVHEELSWIVNHTPSKENAITVTKLT